MAPAKASTTKEAPKTYTALTGINYPDGKGGEKRAEAGKPVPQEVVAMAPWLLDQGCVEEAS